MNSKPSELFLLHGWGIGRAAWAPVVERLAERCPALNVSLLDLPATNGQARQQAPQINSRAAIMPACRLYRMKTRGLNAFKV